MTYSNFSMWTSIKFGCCVLLILFYSMGLLAQTKEGYSSKGILIDSTRIKLLEGILHNIEEQTLTKYEIEHTLDQVDSFKYVNYLYIDSLVNICWRRSNMLNFELGMAKSAYWRAWLQLPRKQWGMLNFYSVKDVTISKNIFQSLGDKSWLSRVYDLLASLATYQNQFDKAFGYLNTAEEILMELDTTSIEYAKLMGTLYNTKGSWAQLAKQNEFIQDSSLSEKFLKRSIAHFQRGEFPEDKAITHINLGAYYAESDRYDLAEEEFTKAEKLLKNITNNREQSRLALFRGQYNLYLYHNNSTNDSIYQTCISQLKKALSYSPENKSLIYVNLGSAYFIHYFHGNDIVDLDLAENHFSIALKLAIEEIDMSNIDFIMNYMGRICEEKKNCGEKFQEIGAALQVLNDSSVVIMNEAQAKSNQFELEFLMNQNEIEESKRTISFLWILLGVILVFSLGLYFTQKAKVRSLRKEIEAKDAAARAQINPHFISNALFAIDSLLDSGKIRKASRYLVQFDRLYRTVLNSSRKAEISLSDEIQFLKNYLSLEQLRFEDRMTFELRTEQLGNEEGTLIPPMILQPILENAFKHGIQNLPAEVKGHIEVKFIRANDQTIRVSVIDDGVGRKKASELRAKSVHKPHGEGQKIIEERIAGFQQKGYMAKLKIIDLYDDHGKAQGTKVNVTLPILKPKKRNYEESV